MGKVQGMKNKIGAVQGAVSNFQCS